MSQTIYCNERLDSRLIGQLAFGEVMQKFLRKFIFGTVGLSAECQAYLKKTSKALDPYKRVKVRSTYSSGNCIGDGELDYVLSLSPADILIGGICAKGREFKHDKVEIMGRVDLSSSPVSTPDVFDRNQPYREAIRELVKRTKFGWFGCDDSQRELYEDHCFPGPTMNLSFRPHQDHFYLGEYEPKAVSRVGDLENRIKAVINARNVVTQYLTRSVSN